MIPRLVVVALALAPLASPQGQVQVVAPAGGGEYTTISAAIAAASNGDVVLLRPAFYNHESIDLPPGKGLAVVADSPSPIIVGTLTVAGGGQAVDVLVQGLQPETLGGDIDEIESCPGPVWIERSTLLHLVGGVGSLGGVQIRDAASVVFARSSLGPPVELFVNTIALDVTASRLHLHGSSVLGVDERTPAAWLRGSFLELFGSTIHGGDGTAGSVVHCDGFDGGNGLVLTKASQAVLLGGTLVGGAGGAPFNGGCSAGAPGLPLALTGISSVTTLAGSARGYWVDSPVRDDELVQATFQGNPGDLVWLFVSSKPGLGSDLPARDGELLLGAPLQIFPVGAIPASGTLVLQVPAPVLGAGVEGAVFYSQAVFRDGASGRFVAGSPSALVVLDDTL